MGEAQNCFEHRDKGMTRSTLFGFRTAQLNFGKFHIPVAVLIPDEGIDGIGSIVEAIVLVSGRHFLHRAFEFADDPLVDKGELHGFVLRSADTAVLSFNVHQYKARSVPKLSAEIAVALSSLQIEVDVAAERCIRRHGEAKGVSAMGSNPVRIVLAELGFNDRSFFGLAQTAGVFLNEVLKVNALDDVERIKRVAFALRHLLAFCVAHEAVNVDILEGHPTREVTRHHHHAGYPEEENVIAGYKHGARQIEVVGGFLVAFGMGPAKSREGDKGGREPRVEHIFVARKFYTFACLLLGFFFCTRNIDSASFVIPGRDLMTPPELTREAPVLNIFEPLTVDAAPFSREDIYFAGFNCIKSHFSD